MTRDPHRTHASILDAAEALILDHGFGGTTVDAVIERAGVTKGAFFHHFASKADLGHALVERYAERDLAFTEELEERAERLSRDPLQQVLLLVALLEEAMDALTEPYPGCLFAAYCYQAQLFDEETFAVVRRVMLRWRDRMAEKLRTAAERHPPRVAVDLDGLADMLTAVLEGSFIISKTLKEPKAVARQLTHYRNYLELLFGVEG